MNWPNVRLLSAAVLLCQALLLAQGGSVTGAANPESIRKSKDVLVTAVGNWKGANWLAWQGLELAAREINRSGGILGKPLNLRRQEVSDDPRQAVEQTQEIAENPRTAMAILCAKRDVALPVSTVLAYYGVLTFFTGESTPFHEVNLPLLFRLCPSDADEMNYLTTFCTYKNVKRVALFVYDNDLSKIHANIFETEARAKGLEIVSRIHCGAQTSEGKLRRDLAALVKEQRFDAIFYSGPPTPAVKLIRAAAAQGVEQPFIGGSQWDTPELADVADPRRTSVYLSTPFAPDLPGRAAQRFIEAYRHAYDESPDAQAVINYNALHLYAQAVQRTGSADPEKVTATLYNKLQWDGPIGEVRLNALGELVFPTLYIKRFTKGKFEIMGFERPKQWH